MTFHDFFLINLTVSFTKQLNQGLVLCLVRHLNFVDLLQALIQTVLALCLDSELVHDPLAFQSYTFLFLIKVMREPDALL